MKASYYWRFWLYKNKVSRGQESFPWLKNDSFIFVSSSNEKYSNKLISNLNTKLRNVLLYYIIGKCLMSFFRKGEQKDILVYYFKEILSINIRTLIGIVRHSTWVKIKQKEVQLYWLLNLIQLCFVKLTRKIFTKKITNLCLQCTHETWLHLYPILHN